jgi:hypothetical protein
MIRICFSSVLGKVKKNNNAIYAAGGADGWTACKSP